MHQHYSEENYYSDAIDIGFEETDFNMMISIDMRTDIWSDRLEKNIDEIITLAAYVSSWDNDKGK